MGDKKKKKSGKGTIKCKICGLEVSSTHSRCPRGHDPRRDKNKARKDGGSKHKGEQKYGGQNGRRRR